MPILGKGAMINKPCVVIEAGGTITLGDASYINSGSHIRAEGKNITIGKNCMISYNVHMITYYGAHFLPPHNKSKNGDIIIGDGAWIGYGAMVRGGVRIGKYAVVGMGAVVTHDVPDYSIAIGNPARVIGLRPDMSEIKKVCP